MNSRAICAICPRLLPDGSDAYACPACEHRMRYVLATIVAELPLLQAALVPGGGSTGGRPVGRAHAPLPVNLRALNLLGPGTTTPVTDLHAEQVGDTPLVALLRGWADWLAQHFPCARVLDGTVYLAAYGGCDRAGIRGDGADVAAWCRWLTRYLPYAAQLHRVDELHRDLEDALARVRAITGTRPQTHPRLAPCPACGTVAMSRTDGVWEVVCEACGHRMDPDAYSAHASAVLPGLAMVMARMASTELTAGAA